MNLIIPFDPATMSVPLPSYATRAAATPAPTRRGPAWDVTELGPLPPDFSADLLNGLEVRELQLPARPALLGEWLKQGDLGYLFAPRGAGKSWMAMLIARAVAAGSPLGEWQAGQQPLPVYYFDAEMNLPDVQARMHSVGLFMLNFHLLSNEVVFKSRGHGINIASVEHQASLSQCLQDGSLFIIDNLSTSQLGMAENDNDSFDAIRDWLLSLRHRGITVLIVHHAGRNGLMRGSSRREDMAHWILSLKEAGEPGQPAHRTTFSTEFSKCRNCTGTHARPLLWTLDTSTTPLTLGCSGHEKKDILLDHIRNGINRAGDLAALMGVHIGTVSNAARQLREAGLITVQNRRYCLVEDCP
jgi:DNA-binding transcriptional ArsR family regulator